MTDEGNGDVHSAQIERTLSEIARTRMAFGKYSGIPIYDLPWEYLHWFTMNGREFPTGQLGQLLEVVYHMKSDGSDEVFDLFRRRAGGRSSLRKKDLPRP